MVIKSQNTYPKKYLISMSNEKDENGFQPFSLALVPGDYKISQIRINLSDYFIDGLLFNVSSSNNSSYIGDIEIFVDKSNKKFTIKIRDNIANNSNYTKSLVIKNNPSINSREKFFCHYGSCSPTSSNLNLPW